MLAEEWEEALDIWSEYEVEPEADDTAEAPSCDLENPDICESCT